MDAKMGAEFITKSYLPLLMIQSDASTSQTICTKIYKKKKMKYICLKVCVYNMFPLSILVIIDLNAPWVLMLLRAEQASLCICRCEETGKFPSMINFSIKRKKFLYPQNASKGMKGLKNSKISYLLTELMKRPCFILLLWVSLQSSSPEVDLIEASSERHCERSV